MASKGRPTGARDRLRNNFIAALADDFKEGGAEAIKAMRANDPSGYVRAIASLMPKEMDVKHQVSPLEQLTDEQLTAIVDATERFLSERGGEAPLNAQGADEQAQVLPTLQ
jgi:hypothetical protein